MNLADGFFASARRCPARAAFVIDDRVISYSELAQSVRAWQHTLLLRVSAAVPQEPCAEDVAVKYSDVSDTKPSLLLSTPRVAWCGSNDEQLPAIYLACVSLGLVLVLLEPEWPDSVRTAVVRRIDPVCVLSPTSRVDASVDAVRLKDRSSSRCGNLTDPFLIGFTSGSTGEPKAFIRTQRSWQETFARSEQEFGSYADKQVFGPGPLGHGLTFYAMAETLNAGGSFYTLSRFDSARCVQHVLRTITDTLVVVPTLLSAMLIAADSSQRYKLKRIVTAGAKLSHLLRTEAEKCFPGVVVSEYYGASELSFVAVAKDDDDPPVESVGRAFSGVRISIREASGACLTPGKAGAVCVRSNMLAEGYLDSNGSLTPLLTVAGWTTVGDVGYLDEHGHLTLVDRADNMLISGGLNVYPAETEKILDLHPTILDSVVVGIQDEYWGDKLCAIVRTNEPATVSLETLKLADIQQHCREYLSPHKLPRLLYRIDRWPLTPSGKVSRRAIVDMLQSDSSLMQRIA